MGLQKRSYRSARHYESLREVLAAAPGMPMQALVVVALLYLVGTDGGYFPIDWYPVGLGILALLAVWAALVSPGRRRDPRAVGAALLFLLFGAWGLLSIGWAGDRAVAWDGGNRALLYAAIFAAFALWPIPARQARWLVALLGLGIAAIGLVELLRAAAAADPTAYVDGGRFSEPVGYHNGNAAVWAMGAFACLWIASAAEFAPLIRGLALGSVSLLAGLALLGQSRASLFAAAAALVVVFAIAPARLRLLAALIPAAIALALAVGPILDVADAPSASSLVDLVDDAARAILLPSLILTAIGAVVGLAERRHQPSAELARRVTRAATIVVLGAALATLAVAATQAGELRSGISDRWDEFKSNEPPSEGSAKLGSGGTNRYDFWTVAWDGFEREPFHGVGMDNFQQDYVARGQTFEKPRFPHSVELALLSGTGIVGTLLFATALLLALLACLRARAGLPGTEAGVVAAALGVFAYLWFHASLDWLYEIPGLGGLGFAALGIAAAARPTSQPSRSAPPRRATRLVSALLAAVIGISFALPWLAERDVERAAEIWPQAPAAAYDRLDRAADLNPLSVRPALFVGEIALERGSLERAEQAFQEVIRREPRNAHAWLELAVIASMREDRPLARARIRRAHALSPRDEAIRVTRQAIVTERRRITHREVRAIVLENARGGAE